MRILDIVNEDASVGGISAAAVPAVSFAIGGVARRNPKKKKKSVNEAASDLHADNVIYRLDPENPMDDTEVLVIGGAGRYSLRGLRDKARKEANGLSKEIDSEYGGSFRNALHYIQQLSNTLRTIVAAYDQLNAIRKRGGIKSRGIRNEDQEFVNECMNIIEQSLNRINSKVQS